MSIYTVENFTSDITVEGYIAEFRDEPHFLELCKQCTNYGKSWGCPPFDFDTDIIGKTRCDEVQNQMRLLEG